MLADEATLSRPDLSIAGRARRVVPFLGALVVALGLAALPPGEPDRFQTLGLAALGFASCGLVIVAVPWDRVSGWAKLVPVVMFCGSVAVVREATLGARSGFAVLLLLAIVWQAAYGRRNEMLATVAMALGTLVLPVVLIGEPRYPDTEWRKAILLAFVGLIVGWVVQRLVHEVRRERALVSTVAHLGQALTGDEDPRHAICEATRKLTGADLVILFEPDGDGLRVSTVSGTPLPRVTIPGDMVPDRLQAALATGEIQLVLDTAGDAPESAALSVSLGIRSWVHQPATRGDRVNVVLTVGWVEPQRRIRTRTRDALLLLAVEAGAAIDRADLVDRLARLARQDPLTGLMNRRAWDDHLEREVARAARTGHPLSVAVLDLDRFKMFNDLYGHLVGDQMLKTAASSWSSTLRSSDVLARWGGEEFAVLMPDTPADEARRILGRLAEHTPMGQTLSAGFVTSTGPVEPEALMSTADLAVYRAKDNGRDRVEEGHLPITRVVEQLPLDLTPPAEPARPTRR